MSAGGLSVRALVALALLTIATTGADMVFIAC